MYCFAWLHGAEKQAEDAALSGHSESRRADTASRSKFHFENYRMWKSMQTIIATFFVFLNDWSYGRVYVSVICGFFIVALIYLLALPSELALWPAVLLILLSGVVGLLWERHSSHSSVM